MEAEDPPDPQVLERVMQSAREALGRAYAPYSQFRVGAALIADGRVFTGSNVENALYGASMCAERVAAFSAVAADHRSIDGLVVVTEGSTPSYPCGQCRQVLHEFNPKMWIGVAGPEGVANVTTLAELFAHPFGPDDLR